MSEHPSNPSTSQTSGACEFCGYTPQTLHVVEVPMTAAGTMRTYKYCALCAGSREVREIQSSLGYNPPGLRESMATALYAANWVLSKQNQS